MLSVKPQIRLPGALQAEASPGHDKAVVGVLRCKVHQLIPSAALISKCWLASTSLEGGQGSLLLPAAHHADVAHLNCLQVHECPSLLSFFPLFPYCRADSFGRWRWMTPSDN